MLQHMKINQCNASHKQNQGQKNHMITSIDVFDKVQQPFMIKNKPEENRYRRSLFQRDKSHSRQTYCQHSIKQGNLKFFPLKSGTKMPIITSLIQYSLQISQSKRREGKGIRGISQNIMICG